jgi:hypothetical protein
MFSTVEKISAVCDSIKVVVDESQALINESKAIVGEVNGVIMEIRTILDSVPKIDKIDPSTAFSIADYLPIPGLAPDKKPLPPANPNPEVSAN